MKNRHNDTMKRRDYKNQKIKYKSHIGRHILFSQRKTATTKSNVPNAEMCSQQALRAASFAEHSSP